MFSNGYELDQKVSSFMAGVYGWMSCALALQQEQRITLRVLRQFLPIFIHIQQF